MKQKKQDKIPQKELSEEISNLPNKEFKVMLLKMFKELRRRIDEHREKINKKLENIKKNQKNLENTITEIKNRLQGINSRLDDSEKWISEL